MSNIKSIKLITGEEIICDLIVREDGNFDLENPIQIIMVPQGGKITFSFVPFPLTSDDKIIMSIDGNHIIYQVEPTQELLVQYKSQFGKIVTPQKQNIIV